MGSEPLLSNTRYSVWPGSVTFTAGNDASTVKQLHGLDLVNLYDPSASSSWPAWEGSQLPARQGTGALHGPGVLIPTLINANGQETIDISTRPLSTTDSFAFLPLRSFPTGVRLIPF